MQVMNESTAVTAIIIRRQDTEHGHTASPRPVSIRKHVPTVIKLCTKVIAGIVDQSQQMLRVIQLEPKHTHVRYAVKLKKKAFRLPKTIVIHHHGALTVRSTGMLAQLQDVRQNQVQPVIA
jgi:hypothetical protein